MANTYKPAYYSSIQHSITSIYKSIFKSSRRRLLTDEQKHAEALKWQQEQFHKMLHLIALHREGIVEETEVTAFRARLLESIAASPANQEPPCVIRDKLLFLQELLHSKCISNEEYHTFKRPLLQRLAILGEEINSLDIKIGNPEPVETTQKAAEETVQNPIEEEEKEEWSTIDLQDPATENPQEKPKHKNAIKQLIKPYKSSKNKEKKENIVVLISKNEAKQSSLISEKGKRREREGGEKKGWGLDGFKKWRRSGGQEEEGTAPCLDQLERSDFLFDNAANSDSDKVLGDNIKKELSWIKTELSATNRNLCFSDKQVEAISAKLPTDKSDLNSYFPKTWCARHGDNVLEVVQKEFKEHVSESSTTTFKPSNANTPIDINGYNKDWVHFDDDLENFHPNLFTKGNEGAHSRDSYVNPFL
ncbi:Uveal autoantigen with coiled-coil domains and ankyrin repeats isoform 1 [Rhynchospora pubera]|uniref:Uveal autoantigen with coiled-coil domains and ankyrin repeats isoform 1 n=1 Tax=Rhynchospora pubera TaxID=906938 RepID=A0AAV8EIY5_9POAL|nr:Uveal autoantigen with coiled-coil domains and ankyrin repeats isoform 1 [Rhynchospora pubera]